MCSPDRIGGGNQGGRAPPPPKDRSSARNLVELPDADARDLSETAISQGEVEDVTSTTEAVLFGRQDAASNQILVLPLDIERDEGIDHVLQLLRACHLAVLGHLTDDDGVAEVLLTVCLLYTSPSPRD